MMNVNVQLGMRVRYLRKKNKMSIEDLALKADINRNYLSDLERGKRNPTLLVLCKICEGLEVTLEFLFKGIVAYDELFWKNL